jgi:hypothetical protein
VGIDGLEEGFTYSGGTYTFINPPGSLPGTTSLVGINHAGVVVGDTQIPEPATWTMMLLGFLGLGGVMRHSKRRQAIAA